MNDQASRPIHELQGSNDAAMTDTASASRNVNILKPGNEDSRLPRPFVIDAEGEELDLGTFAGNTTITCMRWPFIAVGQKVWLAVDGTLTDGSATTLTLWTASNVIASEVVNGLSKTLARSWLEGLRDGSTIDVRLYVTFDGSTEKAGSVAFRSLELTVQQDPADALTLSGPATVVRGSTFQFIASGGRTPYAFASSDSAVARMTGDAGQGSAVSAGVCNISVTDARGGSASKSLTVTAPALYIDPSPVSLSGRIIHVGDNPIPSPPAGTSAFRQASGGTPPYRYVVDRPVVEIDASSGRIVALRNGSSIVRVYDALNQQASYGVSVSDAWVTFGTGLFHYFNRVRDACAQAGGVIPSLADWRLLHGAYNGAPFGGSNDHAWSSDSAGLKTHYAFYTASGAVDTLISAGLYQQAGVGWGMRRYDL